MWLRRLAVVDLNAAAFCIWRRRPSFASTMCLDLRVSQDDRPLGERRRDDQDALDGTDKIGYAREIELVAGFIIWSHMTMKARGGRAAPQPQSAMNRY